MKRRLLHLSVWWVLQIHSALGLYSPQIMLSLYTQIYQAMVLNFDLGDRL